MNHAHLNKTRDGVSALAEAQRQVFNNTQNPQSVRDTALRAYELLQAQLREVAELKHELNQGGIPA